MADTHVLVDILIVLLAAKVAAEGAERLGLPAVVGEIVAGVLIGPSLLGWVGDSELLVTLGEVGVILLLLEVGMEMDVGELRSVGRAAMGVAAIGVVAPMVLGAGAAGLLGSDGTEALFIGAALTATSVGISARVFGDLRALATVEARTVLGAAVADDVLGLVILTVVVRLADAGRVDLLEVATVIAVAFLFLVVAVAVGLRLVPPLFAAVGRASRSAGTLVAVTFAFTLAVAVVAAEARLAPIIGAFVAGLALRRSPVASRVRRELTPVAHLFVPIFFLRIGIDVEVDRFADPSVLALAAVLAVVAVAGKVVAAAGLGRGPGDRLLVGLGMIPRGEVGLIFATIGLQQGVFDQDLYAAVLLVVLVTTVVTPALLRARLLALRRAGAGRTDAEVGDLLARALAAAGTARRAQAPPDLVAELTRGDETPLPWTDAARGQLREVLVSGGPAAWRFLHITGVLARSLPELEAVVARQAGDPTELDPLGAWRWPRVERLVDRAEDRRPPSMAQMLAALALDADEDGEEGSVVALIDALGSRVGLERAVVDDSAAMAGDALLLEGVCSRPWALHESSLTVLAEHLGSTERLGAVADLVRAAPDADRHEVQAVVEAVVAEVRDALVGRHGAAVLTASSRRAAASAQLADPEAERAVNEAPRAHVCSQGVDDLARQAALVASCRHDGGRLRSTVIEDRPTRYRVEIAAQDRIGLLASEARSLATAGYDIESASTATWPDGTALAVFLITGPKPPSEALVVADRPGELPPRVAVPDAKVSFDDGASPWHTLCVVEAEDRRGLVAAVAGAVAAAGLSIHAAHVGGVDGWIHDEFELTGRGGGKLSAAEQSDLRATLATGVVPRPGRRLARRR